jgi:hypothetical protein
MLGAGIVACSPGNSPDRDRAVETQGDLGSVAMTIKDHPDYESIRAYKDAHAFDLMETYGAHSIGIRRKSGQKQDSVRPAIVFYIDPNRDNGSAAPVPPFIEYQPTPNQPVLRIPTEVIHDEQADLEVEPE